MKYYNALKLIEIVIQIEKLIDHVSFHTLFFVGYVIIIFHHVMYSLIILTIEFHSFYFGLYEINISMKNVISLLINVS